MLRITTAQLRSSVEDARRRIVQQVREGEKLLSRPVQSAWSALEEFRAEKGVWSDYATDLLLSLFRTSGLADEFKDSVESRKTSGTVGEFTWAERQGVVRGIGYLRSIEKRLDLLGAGTEVTKQKIPFPVIATVAEALQSKYTHTRMDFLMRKAGVSGEPPATNKLDKGRAWLELANQHDSPLRALGTILEEIMEVDSFGLPTPGLTISALRNKINASLAQNGLMYVKGGRVVPTTGGAVTRTLDEIIRSHDLLAVQTEFERISRNLETDPASAVTAASALLESLFQIYIEDEQLTMPSDKSIKPLWNVIRKDLNLDPTANQDEDLRKTLSGLASVVDGISSLRTHRGSAHGQGRRIYRLKPRHARLVVHAASTLAIFIIETWNENKDETLRSNREDP